VSVRSHDEYIDNIGPYVLDALPELEAELFERHLATCESCRAEVEELRPVTHALARSVPQVEPPPELKQSLMRVVNGEADPVESARTEPRERRRRALSWPRNLQPRLALGGALAVLAIGVVIGVAAEKSSDGTGARTLAAQIDRRAMPRGSATLAVGSKDRTATIRLKNAPRPPSGRVYQLWVQRGKTIERGPTFTVDASGNGSRAVPGGVRGADAVMVTVEKAGGAPAPTRAPIMRFNV
jgi:anti-sigma factor RsiW